jgi:predicted metal-dependent phosphotriesterase family hydrolase
VIRTVLGDIAPDDLGTTLVHEHLLMTGGWPVRMEPDFRLDSVAAAVEEVDRYRAAGGGSIVEMTPLGFGRDPDGLADISRRTGVNIVACTGFHKVGYYADTHWLHHYKVDDIAALLVADIEHGLDRGGLEGPLIDRSEAHAGVMKIATEYQRIGSDVERLAEAVGMAHARTGAPISTHTEQGTMGHAQLDLLARAGVPANAIIVGHIDHNPDAELLAEIASRGAYLGFDMPGRIKYGPESQTIALMADLAERGLADRLLLAGDLARRSYWPAHGGGPGLDYLLTVFVPRLRRAGLGDVADAALVHNPKAALQLRPASGSRT